MCLAVPSKVIEVTGDTALIDVEGVRLHTNIMLLDEVEAGDYVIVHAGFAIQKLDEKAALDTLTLMKEILNSLDG